MTLTDIFLVAAIVLLLLLFLAFPIINRMARTRNPSPRSEAPPKVSADGAPSGEKIDTPEDNGHDLSGGARVEEPAAALESGYRRVDPAHDLPASQGLPAKKNGKPH